MLQQQELHRGQLPKLPHRGWLTENDELWTGTTAETDSSQDARGLIRGLSHQAFSLSTGAVIPVLVKIETVSGTAPATTTVPWSG
ncbi:hypothetical protein GMDG_04767 [Pseudogymnoascus destructans 20631-21]|uniref:Uncharacterized protein n=1 Tax=Pseudogymnoascus destructans (strain ATCC MYA-4855 / 20631-21) TaxID=658429 RepID=L8GCR6_PSED2|nr:hypothetical protein GMDG_04767 [Pseudogymnoascus destructans 20631-21]